MSAGVRGGRGFRAAFLTLRRRRRTVVKRRRQRRLGAGRRTARRAVGRHQWRLIHRWHQRRLRRRRRALGRCRRRLLGGRGNFLGRRPCDAWRSLVRPATPGRRRVTIGQSPGNACPVARVAIEPIAALRGGAQTCQDHGQSDRKILGGDHRVPSSRVNRFPHHFVVRVRM